MAELEVKTEPTAGATTPVTQLLTTTDGKPAMHVKIHSPYQVYFDEIAESLSGENGTGPFDILPHHHNFISLLSPCELNIRASGTEHRIRISSGLMHVKADSVVVFLDV